MSLPSNTVITLEKAHRGAFSDVPRGDAGTASIVRAVNRAASRVEGDL